LFDCSKYSGRWGGKPLRDYSFHPETGQGLVLDAGNSRNVPRANSKQQQQTANGKQSTAGTSKLMSLKLGFAKGLVKATLRGLAVCCLLFPSTYFPNASVRD